MTLKQILALFEIETRNLNWDDEDMFVDSLVMSLGHLNSSVLARVVAAATAYDQEDFLKKLDEAYREQRDFY